MTTFDDYPYETTKDWQSWKDDDSFIEDYGPAGWSTDDAREVGYEEAGYDTAI